MEGLIFLAYNYVVLYSRSTVMMHAYLDSSTFFHARGISELLD